MYLMSARSGRVSLLRPVIDRAARRYVAGPRPTHAVDRCLTLARRGLGTTIACWNETGEPSRRVVEGYLAAADLVARARIDCSLSLRAPALACNDRMVRPIAERCRLHGLGLHFDALGPEVADRTLGLIARVRPERPGSVRPSRVLALARAFGVPARVYVPWGMSRLPYRLGLTATHPSIAWRFLRDLIPYEPQPTAGA